MRQTSRELMQARSTLKDLSASAAVERGTINALALVSSLAHRVLSGLRQLAHCWHQPIFLIMARRQIVGLTSSSLIAVSTTIFSCHQLGQPSCN
jgi:hypothetical protein